MVEEGVQRRREGSEVEARFHIIRAKLDSEEGEEILHPTTNQRHDFASEDVDKEREKAGKYDP
jgi:hypothetical protein